MPEVVAKLKQNSYTSIEIISIHQNKKYQEINEKNGGMKNGRNTKKINRNC